MKNLVVKSLFLLSLILFIDFLLMMALGCTTCFLGFSSNFYDCTFCVIGKSLVIISFLGFLYMMSGDVKSLFNGKKDVLN